MPPKKSRKRGRPAAKSSDTDGEAVSGRERALRVDSDSASNTASAAGASDSCPSKVFSATGASSACTSTASIGSTSLSVALAATRVPARAIRVAHYAGHELVAATAIRMSPSLVALTRVFKDDRSFQIQMLCDDDGAVAWDTGVIPAAGDPALGQSSSAALREGQHKYTCTMEPAGIASGCADLLFSTVTTAAPTASSDASVGKSVWRLKRVSASAAQAIAINYTLWKSYQLEVRVNQLMPVEALPDDEGNDDDDGPLAASGGRGRASATTSDGAGRTAGGGGGGSQGAAESAARGQAREPVGPTTTTDAHREVPCDSSGGNYVDRVSRFMIRSIENGSMTATAASSILAAEVAARGNSTASTGAPPGARGSAGSAASGGAGGAGPGTCAQVPGAGAPNSQSADSQSADSEHDSQVAREVLGMVAEGLIVRVGTPAEAAAAASDAKSILAAEAAARSKSVGTTGATSQSNDNASPAPPPASPPSRRTDTCARCQQVGFVMPGALMCIMCVSERQRQRSSRLTGRPDVPQPPPSAAHTFAPPPASASHTLPASVSAPAPAVMPAPTAEAAPSVPAPPSAHATLQVQLLSS